MTRTHWILAAAIVAFAAWSLVHPMGIASDDAYRDNDWFTDRMFDAAAREALLTHHQLPIRSHQLGGGYPTIGHPFDGSWAPTLLPTLLLGDVLGVKVVLALLLLIGSWGMWGLARSWLGVGPPAAALAALAFAYSGWLPSMWLVGFYPQVLYLLTPALLRLFWIESEERPRSSILLAGFLLFLLLQQAGNAALAVAWFVGVATWLKTTSDEHPALVIPATLALIGVTAPLAIRSELALLAESEAGVPGGVGAIAFGVGWGLAATLILGIPGMRRAAAAMKPWVLRGAALGAIALLLGIGKLVAVDDLLDRGEYVHELSWGYEMWFPRLPHGEPDGRILRFPRFSGADSAPPYRDPDFFMGLGELGRGLLQRVPAEGEYSPYPPPTGAGEVLERPFGVAEGEYTYIGLTAPILLLALIGVGVGRRRAVLGCCFVVVAGICLGPNGPPDLHFLMVKGLPRFESIVQPIKYFGFFIVPVAALLAAGALDRFAQGDRERLAWMALPLLLAWPFVQNGMALLERFEHPVEPWPAEEFWQSVQVGHPDWVHEEPVEIERWGREWAIRELARPEGYREYEAIKRGIGIIDWYGTVELPERAIPYQYVTPTGERIDNPRYPGREAWLSGGEGLIHDLAMGPTRMSATVISDGDVRIVFNQSWMAEMVATGGELRDDSGRVAVDVPGSGSREVMVVWRPTKILGGLAMSLLMFLLWGAALWGALQRERSSASTSQASGAEASKETTPAS
ncbi:MAG: hypothetical protein GY898_17465 [Proteobacteria bacterium]|nr:hypothetical protein [Pseudomonadota bacterium]